MRAKIATSLLIAATLVLGLQAQGAQARPGRHDHQVCSTPKAGFAHCDAHVVEAAGTVTPFVTSAPAGYSPAAMKWFYGWPTSMTAGAGRTVAIVTAYDAPTIASDLAVFSSKFGLPSCTVGSGCLRKVNQSGGTTLPGANAGWAFETSLDVEWVHAIAPGAHILLVEAADPNLSNLFVGLDYAKTHAGFVSMSWGAPEFAGESQLDSHFAFQPATFVAAAGDEGLGAQYPSASPWVVSVGGTSVHTGPFSETAWSGGGGGCSAYEQIAPPQSKLSTFPQVSCTHRATPDISADSDPNTGAPIYDSTPYQNTSGWFLVGGTSLAAPMIAARAADRGSILTAGPIYGTTLKYRDITSGTNGASCLVGYDLCSGRGAWIGS